MADYLADPCVEPSLSRGCAFRLLTESPLHAWQYHPRLGGRSSPPSDASEAGSTAHDMLLGGEGRICEIRREDYRSKPTKDNPDGAIPVGWTNTSIREARDAARANGLTPMLADDLIAVRAMVKAAKTFVASSEIAGVFDSGECELTAIADLGGVWLRARPDWLSDTVCLHYKTTQAGVDPRGFARLMRNMGYDFALAFYRRVLLKADGRERRHLILAQEQSAPYACALYELTQVKADIEDAKVEAAIELWRSCLSTNRWPGFSHSVQQIDAAAWELADTEVSYA